MNFELEENIIGALLANPSLMKNVVISDDCFLDKTNRFIFRLLKKQFDEVGTIEICGLPTNYKKYFTVEYPVNEILTKLSKSFVFTICRASNAECN